MFDPDSVYDALQIDLIGMKDGLERCQMLKTVVYLKKGSSYVLNFLVGGGKYFKLFNVNNETYLYLIISEKVYMWYDSINQISIKDDYVHLKIKA